MLISKKRLEEMIAQAENKLAERIYRDREQSEFRDEVHQEVNSVFRRVNELDLKIDQVERRLAKLEKKPTPKK